MCPSNGDRSDEKQGVSRRGFLSSVGVGAVTVALRRGELATLALIPVGQGGTDDSRAGKETATDAGKQQR